MKKFKLAFFLVLMALVLTAVAPTGFLLAQGGAPTNVTGDFCDQLKGADQDAAAGTNTNLQFIICRIGLILNTIIPILIALGVLYFIWGVITYVIAKDDEAKSRGRDMMIYGLIGLLVIVCIWGLIAILKNTFGIKGSGAINVPCVESPGVDCPGN